jgi:HK97 family phage prohead protease
MSKLDDKIKELKLRAKAIQYSNTMVNIDGTLSAERKSDFAARIIAGYAIVWGSKNMHGEIMLKGCCAKSIADRGPKSNAKYKITMFWQHDSRDPLGMFDILEEDDYGLYFRTKPLDQVPNADRALLQLQSGTLNQFSAGFDYVWDKIEWDDTQDALILKEIDLFELSPVTIASEDETFAIRSKENVLFLLDETESFIISLPRQSQLEARTLFARHKSLIQEPLDHGTALTQTDEPTTPKAIDYSYLLANY